MEYVKITCAPPEERLRVLKDKNALQDVRGSDRNVFKHGKHEKYFLRPANMEGVSMEDAFCEFTVGKYLPDADCYEFKQKPYDRRIPGLYPYPL